MSLFWSFVHNALVHPLLFVADVADRLGVPHLGPAVDALHDATAPEDAPASPPAAPTTHADELPDAEPPPEAYNPRTPETASLEWRPEPPTIPEPVRPPPLQGSARSRMHRGS